MIDQQKRVSRRWLSTIVAERATHTTVRHLPSSRPAQPVRPHRPQYHLPGAWMNEGSDLRSEAIRAVSKLIYWARQSQRNGGDDPRKQTWGCGRQGQRAFPKPFLASNVPHKCWWCPVLACLNLLSKRLVAWTSSFQNRKRHNLKYL
jgi:hypothetical protein